MPVKQYKKLGCLDVNPKGGCAFEVQAENEEELMRLVGDHAKNVHNMGNLPPDVKAKMKGTIKTVDVEV